jgi:hypothetical protein
VILSACGNATLASLIENLSSGTVRARMWQSLVSRDAVDATLAAHRAIYDALSRATPTWPPPPTSCISASQRIGSAASSRGATGTDPAFGSPYRRK